MHKPLLTPALLHIVLSNAFTLSFFSLNAGLWGFTQDFLLHLFYSFSFFYFIFYSFSVFFKPKLCFLFHSFLFYFNLFLFLVNVFLYFNFHTIFNNFTLEILFATSPRESKEFLNFYFDFNNILILLFLLILSLIIYKLPFKINAPSVMKLILYSFLPLLIVHNYIQFNAHPEKILPRIPLLDCLKGVVNSLSPNTHLDLYHSSLKELEATFQSKKSIPNYISMEKPIPKIVLIIGESTNRNYMNIYGFPLNNTPRLKELEKEGKLFVFKDIISPHTYTHTTMRVLFTLGNNQSKLGHYLSGDFTRWASFMNLIDSMKMLHYSTFWFSNQEAISVYGNVEQALAKRSEYLHYTSFLNSKDLQSAFSLKDEALFKLYEKYPPPP